MKKLIIFLGLILISVGLFAQSYTRTCVSKTLRQGTTYYEYTPTAAEYIGGAATLGYDTLYFEVLANKNGPVNCNARVEITSRGGTTDTYDMDVQGKFFENGTYVAVTESAANVAAVELVDTTSGDYGSVDAYRYYRIIVNDDNACATTDSLILSKIIFKFYER